MPSIVYAADEFLLDRLDIADIWITQRKLHWAQIDLAQYLDAHPVLTVDPQSQKAMPVSGATREEVEYALSLFKTTQMLHFEFLSLERWYMSNPSVKTRHQEFIYAKRFDMATPSPMMLGA